MERMKNSKNYESMLWKLLEKEGLADLSQFHQRGFYDEVPLYSRVSAISFLRDRSPAEASEILLGFALKFLNSVVSYEEHRTPFFAAITIWSFSNGDTIVPNLFVKSNSIRDLYDRLTLHGIKTPFGREIQRLVSRLRLADRFEILEDTSTSDEMSRLFIGLSLPPYKKFVPLRAFRKPITAVK